MLKEGRESILIPALKTIKSELVTMSHRYAELPMLSRTHGQTASPTTVGKELANVAYRFQRQMESISSVSRSGQIS